MQPIIGIKYGRIANNRSLAGGRVRPLFHPGPPNKVSIKVAGFPSSSPSTAPIPSYCDGSNESGMFAARVRKRPPCVITIEKNKRGQYYFSQTKRKQIKWGGLLEDNENINHCARKRTKSRETRPKKRTLCLRICSKLKSLSLCK